MSNPRFVVRRLGWHQAPHGDKYTRRLPTARPVACFNHFDDAEYDRRRREYDARSGENPFRHGGATLYFQSSLDNERLHDWMLDGGIDPPAELLNKPAWQVQHRNWMEWWAAFAHTWNDDQLVHAWQGLDKARFFDVIEEPGDTFHILMELDLLRGTTLAGDAHQEGGAIVRVYRNARPGATACERLNDERRRARLDHGWFSLEFDQEAEERWARRVAESRDFAVTEVPGDVRPGTGFGFLVQRRAFDADGIVAHDRDGQDTGQRVPVQLFAERIDANTFRDDLLAAARVVVNPFQVFTPAMSTLLDADFTEAVALLRAPLPHPAYRHPEQWREWWDLCQDEITLSQRAAAWALFADHPLFEVVRVEVDNA